MRFGFSAALVLFFCSLAMAAPSPRQKSLFDFGWRYHLGDAPDAGRQLDYPEATNLAKTQLKELGREGNDAHIPDPAETNLGAKISFVQPTFDDASWRQLDLPHDWAVELPFSPSANASHGFKEIGPGFPQNSIAWYRREFSIPSSDAGRQFWIDFDGVYRNSLVWINGHCLGRHLSGYTGFCYNFTRYANIGGRNVLVVRVDASQFEGWFYEGAGIYRHVWLQITSPLAVAPDGTFVWTTFAHNIPSGVADVHVQTQLLNSAAAAKAVVDCQIIAPDGAVIGQTSHPASVPASATAQIDSNFYLCPPNASLRMLTARGDAVVRHTPVLWSPDSPNLYHLVTTVEVAGKPIDQVETDFGIRTVAFDPNMGFLLNGHPYTIKGTCNHQDFAGVGIAVPDSLQYYRVEKLKEMGCNAFRTSHNPPTPGLLDACDHLGMLVLDENRRADSGPYVLGELKSMILRDRNHPSVFLWSLGNEEPLEGTSHGAAIASAMQAEAHQLDPTRLCTFAMYGGVGKGVSTVIDVQGFNYHTPLIAAYHKEHPDQPIIGTETASTFSTRGQYADDKSLGFTSSFGNGHPHWGAPPWGWWPFFATHPYSSGGFVWTGFDYRGEPNPYKWPCISTQFGILDTCGFPKDIYYYYQAWWADQPVLHIMPHWNWPGSLGKPMLVRVFSNCDSVELFLNGVSQGRQTMEPNMYLDWTVPYHPGVLSARGYGDGKLITETKVETTGPAAAIRLSTNVPALKADGQDTSVVAISIVDAQGRNVPTADNRVRFSITGPGRIIGVGNGDPASHEPDIAMERSAFNGHCIALIRATPTSGDITITATSGGVTSAVLHIRVRGRPAPAESSIPAPAP